MREAWEAWQSIQRQRAHLAEIPVAQLAAITRNMNATGQPLPVADFLLFVDPDAERREFEPEVAASILALEHEQKASPLLRAIWPQVQQAATPTAVPPSVRAWASACGDIWLVNPVTEPGGVRCGLVAIGTSNPGTVTVTDVDRPLLSYRVVIPDRPVGGWFEAGRLLRLAT